MNQIKEKNLRNKKILVRADLNVPLVNGVIQDDYRLQKIMPTLSMLKNKGAITILATHLGRPKNNDPKLSTKQLLPWFKEKNIPIIFEPSLKKSAQTDYPAGSIILLENLRFNPGEKNNDPAFAKQLADCAEYYLNDAFALSHRNDSSITLTPQLFEKDKRFLGPLIETELSVLKRLKENPARPYVVILGGGKVITKLPIIESLLTKANALILTPAIVFTFLQALGKPVGKSLVDNNALEMVTKIIKEAKANNVDLVYPEDYVVALDSYDGPLKVVATDAFPENGIGVSIGPKTLEKIRPILNDAQTIFINAAMGFDHRPDTKKETYQLLKLVGDSSAYKVAGGGNTVADIRAAHLEDRFNFLSTGGGATLAYLAGEELPGLRILDTY